MSLLQITVFGQSLALLLLLAGVILVIGEAIMPGAHFIVIGVALFLSGLIGTVFGPLSILTLVGLVFGTGIATLYAYHNYEFYAGDDEGQTTHSDTLRGEFGRVTEQVTPRGGEVKLESGGFNPYYSAKSEHGTIDVDEEVIVLDPGGGNVLTVAPVGGTETDAIDRQLAQDREQNSTPTESSQSNSAVERETE